jgi:hypothetical protein
MKAVSSCVRTRLVPLNTNSCADVMCELRAMPGAFYVTGAIALEARIQVADAPGRCDAQARE